ncbi:hypothetical protein M514_10126 [Trichuris suis]|uniref:Uncharacterized protein n=1 Tax=Trichuris suis TaxID=68888 RepID=A0A085N0F6_9BILA|nr:hypothetical protein M513_10126 [Trichuris suis]KFD62952.1 hypothetical protein M514_10126 [Trichuris suis]
MDKRFDHGCKKSFEEFVRPFKHYKSIDHVHIPPVAQRIAHRPSNSKVVGTILTRGVNTNMDLAYPD